MQPKDEFLDVLPHQAPTSSKEMTQITTLRKHTADSTGKKKKLDLLHTQRIHSTNQPDMLKMGEMLQLLYVLDLQKLNWLITNSKTSIPIGNLKKY